MGGKVRSGSRKHTQRNDTTAKQQFLDKPRKQSKKATTGEYLGIPFDSLEEKAFLQWAQELKRAGYIKSIERSPSFLLSSAMTIDYAEQLKTKSKPMQQTILHGHSYTPEFIIYWDRKASGKFVQPVNLPKEFTTLFLCHCTDKGELYTYVEIKPMFDQNNMERLFKVNQKWMLAKHHLFVNLIKCPELFAKSFTPTEYLTTPTGLKRKIKWRIRNLYTYLNGGH